jgi:CheY-like chemotaxis protein
MSVSVLNPLSSHNPVVLCVDDDLPGLRLRKIILEQSGFKVITASDGAVALSMLEHMSVDIAVLDFEMPGMDGASLAASIQERFCIPIVILSGFTGTLPESLKILCRRVISKGEPPTTLIETLRMLTAPGSQKSDPDGPGDTARVLRAA